MKSKVLYYCIKYYNGERSIVGILHDFPSPKYDELMIIGGLQELKQIYNNKVDYIRVKNQQELVDLKEHIKRTYKEEVVK